MIFLHLSPFLDAASNLDGIFKCRMLWLKLRLYNFISPTRKMREGITEEYHASSIVPPLAIAQAIKQAILLQSRVSAQGAHQPATPSSRLSSQLATFHPGSASQRVAAFGSLLSSLTLALAPASTTSILS